MSFTHMAELFIHQNSTEYFRLMLIFRKSGDKGGGTVFRENDKVIAFNDPAACWPCNENT